MVSGEDLVCFDESIGSVGVIVMGGIMFYQYSWSNGGMNSLIDGFVAGIYIVIIIDVNFCIIMVSVILNNLDVIDVNVSVLIIICGGIFMGSVIVIVIGGIGMYIYMWSDG